MASSYYKRGDYNVICDISGFKYKRSECQKTWDGFIVHRKYFERRHPQDFVKASHDRQAVPEARPPGEDVFVTDNQVKASDL